MPAKLSKFLRDNIVLLLIITFGFIVRTAGISDYPPSLNWDEASHGYNAYSILTSAKDEWGETLPLIFRAYGDYKLPLYIYLTSLSIFFFGLSEIAIRLPSVLAGTGTILFTYLLTKELFSNGNLHRSLFTNHRTLALVAAFLVAIEPWTFFISRAAFEANLALFFFVSGVYFFIRSINSLHTSHYSLLTSSVLFGLTLWTYNSYRIFTPLMMIALVLIFRKELLSIYKKSPITVHSSLITIFIFFIPMFNQLLTGAGQARYGKVAIIDQGAINSINEARGQSPYSDQVDRLLHNKATFFIKTAVNNWISHFSPEFLFLDAGSQYQYNVPGHGLIYLISLPFILMGLFLFLKQSAKEKGLLVLLLWLLISPVAAAITRDSPHALRTVTMLPLPMILTAMGIAISSNFLNGVTGRKFIFRSFHAVLVLVYIFSFGHYTRSYINYSKEYSWSWQYGYRETVNFTKENYDEYQKIIVTKKYGEPHIFFLLYGGMGNDAPWNWKPEDFRNDPDLVRFEQSDWYWVDRFDKFYFVNDWDIPKESDEDFRLESGEVFNCDFEKCMLITSPRNRQQDWKLLDTINFLDNTPAFEIYEK